MVYKNFKKKVNILNIIKNLKKKKKSISFISLNFSSILMNQSLKNSRVELQCLWNGKKKKGLLTFEKRNQSVTTLHEFAYSDGLSSLYPANLLKRFATERPRMAAVRAR